jgi:hypothetical protein
LQTCSKFLSMYKDPHRLSDYARCSRSFVIGVHY